MYSAAHHRVIGSIIGLTVSFVISAPAFAEEWIFQHAAPVTRQINTELRPMPASERDPLIVLLALDPAQQRLLDDLDAARLRDMHDAWLPYMEWKRLTNFAAGQGLVEGDAYRAERLVRLKPVEAAAEEAEAAMFEDLRLILNEDQQVRWLIMERWRDSRQFIQWSPHAGVVISDLVLAYMEAMHEPERDRPEARHAAGQNLPLEIIDQWLSDLEAAQRRLSSVADSFSGLHEEFAQIISTGVRRVVDGQLVIDPAEAATSFNAEREMRPRLAEVALRAIPIYEQAAARTIDHAQVLAEILNPVQRERFLRRIEQDKSTVSATQPAIPLPPSPTLDMIEKIEHLTGERLIERPLPFHHNPIHDLVRARWQAPSTNAFDALSPDQRRAIQTIAENHLERIAPLRESFVSAVRDNPRHSMLRVRAGDWVINFGRARAEPNNPIRPNRPTNEEQQAIQRQLAAIEIQTVEQLREAMTVEQRIEIQLLRWSDRPRRPFNPPPAPPPAPS